jgi:hypothetical protein
LFADGCIAQNKNNINLHALIYFLYTTESSIEQITMFFPVRGHSFLPADRVVGRVEIDLRKHEVISSKEKYYDIYGKFGDVL